MKRGVKCTIVRMLPYVCAKSTIVILCAKSTIVSLCAKSTIVSLCVINVPLLPMPNVPLLPYVLNVPLLPYVCATGTLAATDCT